MGLPLRSAGGVVARSHPESAAGTEVALVHRPRFDDWSLPKGKLKRDEHPLAAAVREVREETGVRALVGARLPTVSYDVWAGDELREKVVDYWAMTVAAARRRGGPDARWTRSLAPGRPGAAAAELSARPPGAARLRRAPAAGPADPVAAARFRRRAVGVVRATTSERPLDEAGRAQAAALRRIAAAVRRRPRSSAPSRCAASRRWPRWPGRWTWWCGWIPGSTRTRPPELAAEALRELADPDGAVVVCSQGALIPEVVGQLNGQAAGRYRTAKAEGWALSFPDQRLAAIDPVSTEA